MPTLTKTAFLGAIAALAMGLTMDPAAARDGRGLKLNSAAGSAKSVAITKVGDRRYRKGHRHWSPPRRHYRPKYRHWKPRPPRYYRPKHRHWKRHRHGGNDALFGALVGFAIGAVVADSVNDHHHHHTSAVVVGGRPAGGVLIGYGIGTTMAPADHVHAAVVLEKTRTGHAVEWTNPDTGNRYSMTPTRTFRNGGGEDCRDYTVWGWVDGYEEKLHGTACRTADGVWRTVS